MNKHDSLMNKIFDVCMGVRKRNEKEMNKLLAIRYKEQFPDAIVLMKGNSITIKIDEFSFKTNIYFNTSIGDTDHE